DLAKALNDGKVENLIILGANPIYDAPADLDWACTQRKAKNIVRLGYREDETGAVSDWQFPLAHYLESWGDARTSDGTLVAVQPLIMPLFGGMTELELLARLAGAKVTEPYDIVRETFFSIAGDGAAKWNKFLFDGFLAGSAPAAATGELNLGVVTKALASVK